MGQFGAANSVRGETIRRGQFGGETIRHRDDSVLGRFGAGTIHRRADSAQFYFFTIKAMSPQGYSVRKSPRRVRIYGNFSPRFEYNGAAPPGYDVKKLARRVRM